MKEIVGLVAIRTESSRLKNKAFKLIQGISIIDILINRLKDTPYLDDFIICTTDLSADDAIEELCDKRKIKCFRGDEKDVLGRFMGACELVPSRYCARITGDNPLSDFEQMHNCFNFLKQRNLDYSRPDGVPFGAAIEVMKTSALEEINNRTLSGELSEYMTWFFELAPFIKFELYQVEEAVRMPDLRLTVDYEEDVVFLNDLIRYFNHIPTLKEIVDYCKKLKDYPKANFRLDLEQVVEIKSKIKFKGG